jgi:hypothetical protein
MCLSGISAIRAAVELSMAAIATVTSRQQKPVDVSVEPTSVPFLQATS